MRGEGEIQAAHDRLVAILVGEVPNPFDDADTRELSSVASVLCWVLRHDHNPAFADNLAKIDQFMREQGLELGEGPQIP